MKTHQVPGIGAGGGPVIEPCGDSHGVEGVAPAPPKAVGLPTGVVTFLLSDVEGSTRLWEGDEAEMGAAIARHYELLDAAIVLHGGVRPAEQGEGDSVVGAFARPSDAVAAALSVQRAFAEEPWPAGRELRIRLVLHTGEAQLRGPDYYVGRTVIRCARLRGIAHGGQTLLSAATRDLAVDRLPDGASLRDLGVHRLKDLGAPERVWQLCHPDLADDFPALRSLDALANNLPAQLTSFVGRDGELAELRLALADARLLTLTGAGGAGKTRLAVHAIAEVADQYADGVWWVELAPLSDPELLPFVVARGTGVRVEESRRGAVETLCERLASSDALLALDNCEHLVDACAALVARLLAAAPGLRVIATSREPLGIPGEIVWRVPPLGAPAATRLFLDRARQVRPAFTPNDAEAEAVGAICRRLDGIPLAIELAAARLRMMSPGGIAAALDDRFRLLTGGGRTALPRQQTLETSVAWSHDLLAPDERVLLRRLSAFAGVFTLEAAEAVGAAAPLDRYAVLDLLGRLVDKSLVHVEHEAGGRYRVLETIRLYAAQRLLEAGEGDATRDRHLDHFLDLAESAALEIAGNTPGADQQGALDRLVSNFDNLQAAYVWGLAAGHVERALRLATAATALWRMRGRRGEGCTWLDDALALSAEVATEHRVRALIARNRLEQSPGPEAVRRIHEVVRLARELGDRHLLAMALANGPGGLALPMEQHRAHLLEAAALAEEIGDGEALLTARQWLGLITLLGGEPAEAARLLRPAIELARERNNGYVVRVMTAFRCMGLLMCGQARAALPPLETVTADCTRLGERTVAIYAYGFLGWAWGLLGDRAAAAEASARAAALSGLNDAMHDGVERLAAGMVALARGDTAEAEAAFARGMTLWGEARGAIALYPGPWAEAALAGGDLDGARRIADDGIARTNDPPLRWQAGWALQARARVALADGETLRAEDLTHQALALRHAIDDAAGLADSLEFLAGLAAGRDGLAEAARLLGSAHAARDAAGCVRFAVHAHVAAMADGVRERLGERAHAEAWAQGAALSPADAVAYASRGRGERRRPSSGWDALTRTELEVAGLVASGLRNKEIAERLFVSPRTVQCHLSNAYTKLGLTSRTQLAQEVVRHRSADGISPGGAP